MPTEPSARIDSEIDQIEVEERHADQTDVDRDAQQTEAIIRAMGSRDRD